MYTPTPGPATPDTRWAGVSDCNSNRTALTDRGYTVTAPVGPNRLVYGVPDADLSGPASGSEFSAPVFRWLANSEVEWLIVAPGPELDALAADLRRRFSVETAATRDFVAQFSGGW